ncbi:MAG: ABC transporter permease [Cytophagaceae bacterium]
MNKSPETFFFEYEIKPQTKLSFNIGELWQYKELFYFFTWRDIKVKYKQTFLGFLWAVLQPLLMMLIFTYFFGRMLNVPSDNVPYPVFVYSGLMFWNLFSSGVTNAANSMVTNSNIIKKIYFPRLIIPLSSVLVSVFDFVITLALYILLMVYYSNKMDINVLSVLFYFPLSLVMTLMTTLGLGSLLASLNVKFRDFRYALPFLIQLLFFVTPVIYPSSVMNNKIGGLILSLNPLTGSIELIRLSLIGSPINWSLIIPGIIISVVMFILGLYYFRKTESYFADIA